MLELAFIVGYGFKAGVTIATLWTIVVFYSFYNHHFESYTLLGKT